MRKSLLIWILVAVVILASLTTGLIIWNLPKGSENPPLQSPEEIAINITMVGAETVTVEFGDSYTDAGASAAWHYADEPNVQHTIEIQCDNSVDLTKLGSYTVTYSAEYNGVQQKAVRTVLVVDTKAPTIELISNDDSYTLPNQEYQEEGFHATDNYDGDITNQVQRIVSENGKTITYRVSDSSGNTAEVVREIVFDDRTAPTLTLKGEQKITITAGDKWNDPGYTAEDNVDGDLSGKVEITGSVNHRTAGTYELTYTVKDQFGNTATAKRTVVVKAAPKPQTPPNTDNSEIKGDGNGKVIYLTFDDGPSKHTERLLQILDKYNVKATFFVCKTRYLHLLDDIVNAGHSIGIHSSSHKYSQIYASDDAFFQDFEETLAIIEEHSGVTPTISRFPGGSSNSTSKKYNVGIMTRLAQAIQERGFQYFDWNIDSDDAGSTKTTEGVYQNVIKRISKSKNKHLVVLQHDTKSYSVDAVEKIIIWGLENGYTFEALTADSPPCHHSIKN